MSVVTDILGTEKALEQAKKGALYRCNSRHNPSHCCCVAAIRRTLNEPSMILIYTTLIILMIYHHHIILINIIITITYRQIVSAATNEGGYLRTEEVERHHPQVMRFMRCFPSLLAIMRLLF